MDAYDFNTMQEIAEAVGVDERHISRLWRLACFALIVPEGLTCGRESSAVRLYDFAFWQGRRGESRWGRLFAIERQIDVMGP